MGYEEAMAAAGLIAPFPLPSDRLCTEGEGQGGTERRLVVRYRLRLARSNVLARHKIFHPFESHRPSPALLQCGADANGPLLYSIELYG